MVTEIILSDGTVVVVSPEDYEWARAMRWSRSSATATKAGYAARGGSSAGKRWLKYMHREIAKRAGVLDGDNDPRCIDHINRDHFDNRRSNLRAVDYAENNGNVAPRTPSGMLGVYLHRKSWTAEVQRHGRRRRRNGFLTPEAASAWRDEALEELRSGR